MYDRIPTALEEIESRHECHILYACESGSRAWGFPSPDSDFDVRFIYVHPLEWYLRVDEPADTIEWMDSDALDFSGWELRKALRLLAGCNPSLNEWFRSPIIYRERTNLRLQLAGVAQDSFNPKKAFHHYLSLARNTAEHHLEGDEIGIKKLFYILRPLHCCLWIQRFQSMPPTRFPNLLECGFGGAELVAWIRETIEAKREQNERNPIRLPEPLQKWIERQLEELPALTDGIAAGQRPKPERLNTILAEKVHHPDREMSLDLCGPGSQMHIEEAYDILRSRPGIEDFDERVERLVEISGLDAIFCCEFLWIEAGGSDVIEVPADD